MRFAKQSNVIRVTANQMLEDDRDASRANRHGPLLPNSVRGVICGPSGCGKTNVLLTMLESPNGLHFENVYVYSKSLHQPKYRYLEQVLSLVDGIEYFPYSDNTEIVPPRDARPDSIFVFDDVACDEQNTIREYFSMGRHSNVDCFYLCQSYARIPKYLIRGQRKFSHAIQTRRHELAPRVQRSCEHRHDVRVVQRLVCEMLASTIRFRGDR